MPRPRLLGQVVGQPGQPLLGGLQPDHPEAQRLAVERAAQHEDVVAELLGHVGRHAGVGRGGGGQDGDAVGQVAEQRADPPVVGTEVVAPVGDAVGLVDDQQPAGGRELRQHLVAEPRVVEPLGRHQQHVDLAGADLVVDRLPLLHVGGVDGDGADARPLGRRDLVAHQRQQRRDDDRRTGALLTEQQGGHEVDRGLAPAGALHDQGATLVDRERGDRRPLVVVEDDVVAAHQRPQVLLGRRTDVGRGGGGHAGMSTSGRRPPG